MSRAPLCKDKHPDGRVCALYLDHYGDHKENHLRSSWSRTMKADRLQALLGSFEDFLSRNGHTVTLDVPIALDQFGVTVDELMEYLEERFSGNIERRTATETYQLFHISKKDQK